MRWPSQPASWVSRFGPEDSPGQVLCTLLKADARALEDTVAELDFAALGEAVRAISDAPRIDLYAVGGSACVAEDLRLRLHRIGRGANSWSDVHNAPTSAALLGAGDVAVGISHSGETIEVLEPLQRAARQGARTVAITNYPRSPLARASDVVLLTAARDVTFRTGGLSGRHAQMLVWTPSTSVWPNATTPSQHRLSTPPPKQSRLTAPDAQADLLPHPPTAENIRMQSPHEILGPSRRFLLLGTGATAAALAVNAMPAAAAQSASASSAVIPSPDTLPLTGGPELPVGLFWPPHPYASTAERFGEIAEAGFDFVLSGNYAGGRQYLPVSVGAGAGCRVADVDLRRHPDP